MASCSLSIASFPGLPTIQFLIVCRTVALEAIKNWMVGRPGNEATLSNGYVLGYSGDARLELTGFK